MVFVPPPSVLLQLAADLPARAGLYGFDVRGPSSFPVLQMHYWHNVLNILRAKVGAEVIVTSVPPCVSACACCVPAPDD
jgi:hypothetical protein